MKPERLSASSIATFEACEARFKAVYIDKASEMSGRAANLGTACHEALEWLVVHRIMPGLAFEDAEVYTAFENAAARLGLSAKQIVEGRAMIKNVLTYHAENGWNEVLSAELKETFTLTHPVLGQINVTYIWDRGDRLADGSIEVVDYKTFARPVAVEDLIHKIQVRTYALSAAIKYKAEQPARIWVTYWLLRYGPVSMAFTREDNAATWKYLRDVWERIDASDGSIETVNAECKWCIRKAVCGALHRHTRAGGVVGLTDEQAARQFAEISNKISALNALKTELETVLSDSLEADEVIEKKFDGVRVFVKPTNRREVDSERVSKVVGAEMMAKYGSVGVGVLDTMMKDEPSLTPDQKLQLKRLIRNKPGSKLEVELDGPMEDV